MMMRCINSEYKYDNLSKSAIVFSPHFDDETLGCGGTIIKKKKAGADVKIVFMTDGSKSHRIWFDEDELRAIRTREALAACQSLGLGPNDVFFLGFKDSKLNEYTQSAITKVLKILQRQQPDEIFIPYYKEPPSWSRDHLATNSIVLSAAQVYGREVAVYEYPIGFWLNCLWAISVPANNHYIHVHTFLGDWKRNLLSSLSLLVDFRCYIYIGDALERKRGALDQYKSQMTRLVPHPHYTILGDVLNGEFLKFFFQEYEIFRRYVLT
jgi:LmbE family N-acetylglucosaminyl deacetylase